MKSKFLILGLFFISISLTAQEVDYSILSIDPSLTKNANAVVRDFKTSVDVSTIDKMKHSIHKVITVLNEKGNKLVRANVSYDDDTTIDKLKMYIYDAFGKEIEHFRKKDFKDVSQTDGYSLYSDSRILYIDYIPKKYPYTVVFTAQTTSNNSAFVPRWKPLLNYNTSTDNSTYTITYDPANKPNYNAENIEGYDVSIEETPIQFIAKARAIPAIRYEEHAPSFEEFAPKLTFALKKFSLKGVIGAGNSWKIFGTWMDKSLLKGTNDLSPKTIADVQALVANEKTNIDKARKIYRYLQDKVRYISVQIGIGGWKPMKASEVDKLSYGDCKALSNYTKSLLDAVGVPSYYTILYSDVTEYDISQDFVAMQGNHAILGVPDGDNIIWLECTSQDVPFGYMGNGNDDRDVLIVTDEGGKIVHTKKYTAQENHQSNTAEIELEENGDLKATITRVSKGLQYGNKFRRSKLERVELVDAFKEDWSYINGLSINNVTVGNDKSEISFTENAQLEAPNYMSKVGDNFIFCTNVFNQWQYIPPRIENRHREVKVSLSYIDDDIYTIHIPKGYTIDTLPDSVMIEKDFGTYEISFEQKDEATIIYKRKNTRNKGVYPAETYKEYRSFLKKIAKLDKTKILLKRQ